MNRIMVTRKWLEAGLHLAIGSDAPQPRFITRKLHLQAQ